MAPRTVFFSWQSDTRAACNRTLIGEALEAVLQDMQNANAALECVVDRDTVGVPGAPDIGSTIFSKIDAAACFVADVTIINDIGCRRTPNPNVLIELGYAIKGLGWDKIVLVQNTVFGRPEDLPFDLRGKRTTTYDSPENATERAPQRRNLKVALQSALSLILTIPSTDRPLVSVSIGYKTFERSSQVHKYQLQVATTNESSRTFKDWHLDIEFPTALFPRNTRHANVVQHRDNSITTLLRFTSDQQGILYPKDTNTIPLDYIMDHERYRKRHELFEMRVVVRVYAGDLVVAECTKRVEDLQNY